MTPKEHNEILNNEKISIENRILIIERKLNKDKKRYEEYLQFLQYEARCYSKEVIESKDYKIPLYRMKHLPLYSIDLDNKKVIPLKDEYSIEGMKGQEILYYFTDGLPMIRNQIKEETHFIVTKNHYDAIIENELKAKIKKDWGDKNICPLVVKLTEEDYKDIENSFIVLANEKYKEIYNKSSLIWGYKILKIGYILGLWIRENSSSGLLTKITELGLLFGITLGGLSCLWFFLLIPLVLSDIGYYFIKEWNKYDELL